MPFQAARSEPAEPKVPTQLPWGALGDAATGGAPASPRKMPASTAFEPAWRSTTIGTSSPALTEIGKLTQAPPLKLAFKSAVWPPTLISSPGVAVRIQGVEVDIAGEGRREFQRQADLGAVVGARLAPESVRAL